MLTRMPMPIHIRRPAPALPPYLHKILELLMYPGSLSQLHNAASVLELSRSLEFENEVRREMTLQVMRWFGQVDDAGERWKMMLKRWCVKSAWVFCVSQRLV